jgi:BON domain
MHKNPVSVGGGFAGTIHPQRREHDGRTRRWWDCIRTCQSAIRPQHHCTYQPGAHVVYLTGTVDNSLAIVTARDVVGGVTGVAKIVSTISVADQWKDLNSTEANDYNTEPTG